MHSATAATVVSMRVELIAMARLRRVRRANIQRLVEPTGAVRGAQDAAASAGRVD